MRFEHKKKQLQPLAYLCIWTIFICVLSLIWYGLSTREEKIKENNRNSYKNLSKEEDEPFRGNNIYAYIELIQMPPETAFENIRVMIVNKKNNSIFYDLEDFAEVKADIDSEGYRGRIIYQEATNKEDAFVVINELPLEEYLYGVVPSEMPSGYPMEALKAQAICARTYAVIHMMNPGYPDYNVHVNDTTAFQVYHNIDEQESTNRAVDETRGMLLFQTNGEELVETCYYSTSCGLIREASTNVEFKEHITRTNSSDIEANESWYRWWYEVTDLDKSELLERMQARYKVNPKYVLTCTGKDTYESLPVNELKTIQEFFVSKRGDDGVAEELMIHTAKNVYKVVGEYNIRYVLNDASAAVIKQDGSKVEMATLLPSAYISLEAVKQNDTVTGYEIIGGGYGHGVGMSQNGAKGMANLGYTVDQILDYFFPGCMILENL